MRKLVPLLAASAALIVPGGALAATMQNPAADPFSGGPQRAAWISVVPFGVTHVPNAYHETALALARRHPTADRRGRAASVPQFTNLGMSLATRADGELAGLIGTSASASPALATVGING
jgi:hypothetical protein